MTEMQNVDDYRQQIFQSLVARYTEEQARALAKELTDEELIDGIDFNTPEEVAQLLMESGLEK